MKVNEIIISPILTEKATNLAKEKKVYMFLVNLKANKNQIKTVLEKLYPVKIDLVRTLIKKGKKQRVGKKLKIKKLSSQKVAFVKLKKGEFDFFPVS